MIERPKSDTIIRSIVGLAHNLDLRVIAEGIETAEQLNALTALGCEYGQGYFFSRPLPPDQIETMLHAAFSSNTSFWCWPSERSVELSLQNGKAH
jgi:EAL domain-containing protein (putative c-di-GMP-specific phosphodiesterase class I)